MRVPVVLAAFALTLAACAPPAAVAEPRPGLATLRLGETARIGGLGVRAIRVEEDSRCPARVQCVQAGTVRLAVALGARETVLRLHQPLEVERGLWLLLAAVCPAPLLPGPVAPTAYRFTLAAAEGAPPPPLDHACPPSP